MATHRETKVEKTGWRGLRLSWGAIVGGVVIAMVVQILLTLLGIGIGFGALNFAAEQPLEGFGIGAGIWAVLSALISLFVGGLAAGHMAGVMTRFNGMMHGVLVWGLATIVTVWAISSGVGTLLGGVFGVAGQTLSGAVAGAGQVGAAVVGADAQGVPQIAQAENREEIANVLQQQTDMSRQEAEEAADAILGTRQQVQLQAEQVRERAPEVATDIAGTISTAAWWALLASILSLAAAAGGAVLTSEE